MTLVRLTPDLRPHIPQMSSDECEIRSDRRCTLVQGWGLLSQFPPFRYFPNCSSLSKHTLAVKCRVYIWQVSPQLSCGDTCQIWMWFEESNMYSCKIDNFAYGEINERSFSNPHPRWTLPNRVPSSCPVRRIPGMTRFTRQDDKVLPMGDIQLFRRIQLIITNCRTQFAHTNVYKYSVIISCLPIHQLVAKFSSYFIEI